MSKITDNLTKGNRISSAISYLKMQGLIKEQKDLCEIIDKDESSISRAINGVNGYGNGVIKNMVKAFPELNHNYLMTGEGELLLENKGESAIKTREYYMAKYIESLEVITRQKDEIKFLEKQIDDLKNLLAQQSSGTKDAGSAKKGVQYEQGDNNGA